MPPPKDIPNPVEDPGDYSITSDVNGDTYPEIDPKQQDFTGKVIFITGASGTLGRAAALSFAKAGASKIALAARSDLTQVREDVEAAAESAGRNKPTVLTLFIDVKDEKSVAAAATRVEEEFKCCDVVINYAGVAGIPGKVAETDPTEWWDMFQVNLYGSYLVARSFLPLLAKGGDARYLILVGSVCAHFALPGVSSYHISKLGVIRLAECINAEYAEEGITCISIHPGNVFTKLVRGIFDKMPPEIKHVFTETPELSGDALTYITSEDREWLGGRYVNLIWNMPELMSNEEEIVEKEKLFFRLKCY
ncbi:short chain dehydrogenase [Trichophyton mentagrophytes]|nr:short chain dehydrogenase [Trichophyton mentagrophytes]